MMEDVNTGIGWVLQKISNYGGDPEQVYLVGQSCGGQLCTLTTLIQVSTAECTERNARPSNQTNGNKMTRKSFLTKIDCALRRRL